ncbi:pentatricopeptide repeat-containing protein [Cinnamomum micranthum f. kanehirae]|uniref:Pentatricopeptide repeat-containing protein n=1 Tax=Cinnamomum micranthum f. kanehirae TaxID=337451 RepID=A0A443PM87_9MAGN|nr:pentatricopeptide repeat-containing protein [Cinnamomum micranthum f. kanehirae]
MEARGFVVDLVTISSLLITLHKHGRWDRAERLMKHVRDSGKTNMEASMRTFQNRGKDFTSLFPSDGDLSEIMSFMDLTSDLNTDANLNSESGSQDKVNSFSGWSSSPHMDRMVDGSEPFSSSLFSISRGQRVHGIGAKSFDIDMVNTYMSIFVAQGKLSVACKLFEIFTEMGRDPVIYTYNTLMSSFIKKGYFKEVWVF